jgi:putative ABC transport system permease protein
MSALSRLRLAARRLVAPLRAPEVERQMTDEMRFHIDMEVADLVAQGVTRDDAERTARARFGGLERYKDEGREVRGTGWLADLGQDVRYARRTLRRNAGYTAVSVLTLGLAIGASTTIFGVMNGVLLKPLPFPASDKLFQIWDDLTWIGVPEAWVTGPEVIKLRESLRGFTGVAAIRGGSAALSTSAGEPEQIALSSVTANFFSVLRRHPEVGRGFLAEEDVPNGPRALVISHSLWRRKFGGDSSIVGSKVLVDGQPTTIVGVLPRDFQYALQSSLATPATVDAYRPLQLALADRPRSNHFVGVVARVRDEVPVSTALGELSRLSAGVDSADYRAKGFKFAPVPVRDRLVREVRPAIMALMSAVALLVVIMCANLATLALARSSRREREFAVRRALGAGYSRIARQVLTETTVISVAGAVVGVFLAWWGIKGLLLIAPAGLPRRDEIGIDAVVVLFTLALGLLVGLAMGLAPFLQSTRSDISSVIGERTTTGRGARLRHALVVAQVALSMMLLAGTGLLLASFARLMKVDGGFTPNGAIALTYVTPPGKYRGSEAAAYHERVANRMRALPGVKVVGVGSAPPLSANSDQSGAAFPESPTNTGDMNHDGVLVDAMTASPGYFEAMGIRMLEGRDFRAADDSAAAQVVIIDEPLAKRYFPKGSALGKRIRIDGDTTPTTVVAVVSPVRMYGLEEGADRPQVYRPDAQSPYRGVTTIIRAEGEASRLIPSVRAAFRELDPSQPITTLETMDDVVSRALGESRLVLVIVSAFALTALLLAAIGIYGVTSSAVASRTREMGIRVALGAQRGEVLALMVRRPLALVSGGVALGLMGTVATGTLVAKLLYGISPTDPLTIAAVTLTLLAVAAVSAYAPASRATRVDAARVLRAE